MIVEYNCEACGTHVRRRRSPATMKVPPRFCSQKCNGAARRGTGSGPAPNCTFDCEVCGKQCSVYRSPSAVQPRFCSVQCTGRAQRGEGNPSFNGGRFITHDGYVLRFIPWHPNASVSGYVYEHRLVMEKSIGRHLLGAEVVHHRNRIKSDNRIENLQLLASQSEHMKLHHREDSHD